MNTEHIIAALNADLSKNGYKAFLVMLMKTTGYGKTADAITDSQISHYTGIRKDHAKKAIQSVLDAGLFERTEHHRYDWEYSIPKQYQWHGKKQKQDQPKPASPALVPKSEIQLNTAPTPALEKPGNLPEADYDTLRPALQHCKQAQDILNLISKAITDGSVRTSPVRFGFALIKAAQCGQLDTSALRKTSPPEDKQRQAEAEQRLEAASLAAFMKTAEAFGVNLKQAEATTPALSQNRNN